MRRCPVHRLGGGGGDFLLLSKSKMPGYILSVTVACGILVARFFEQALANPGGKAARITRRAAVTLAVLCFVVALAAIYLSSRMSCWRDRLGFPVAEAARFGPHFITPIIFCWCLR